MSFPVLNAAKLLLKLMKNKSLFILPLFYEQQKKKRKSDELVTDVVIVMTDHFEPPMKTEDKGSGVVEEWIYHYQKIAKHFFDSDGVKPQHTWFYRSENRNDNCMHFLNSSVYEGFGEIEFHLHHGNDTSESFSAKIREGLNWFNSFGAMISIDSCLTSRFAYIAGNWALDNGAGNDAFSGVDDEIKILADLGCYADFTFPAFSSPAQPEMINSIYVASEDGFAKSYNKGELVNTRTKVKGDLLMVQGPTYLSCANAYIEYAALENFSPHIKERLNYWFNAAVCIDGHDNWRFIKLHTHGIQSADQFRGAALEQHFNDIADYFNQKKIRFHYVTARECSNIIYAAEQGLKGNAGQYRDYVMSRPLNRLINLPCRYNVIANNGVLTAELMNTVREGDIKSRMPIIKQSGNQISLQYQ